MLDDGARRVRGRQQSPLAAVEYIDLQDNKHYKGCAYGSPSVGCNDSKISTSQSQSKGGIEKILNMAIVHDGGSTSYDKNWCQQLNIAESHQDVPMDEVRELGNFKARNNTTTSPSARNSRQQLQMITRGDGADVKFNAPSRDCQWGLTNHAKANAAYKRAESPTLPRKRPHMCMTVDLQESDWTSGSEAAKSPKPRLTSIQPLRRAQVHNGLANTGSDANADSAGSHPPQKERNAQARPLNPPKMGFAALESFRKPRSAPFGTLKIDPNLLRKEEDQLFVSASDDQGQEVDRLGSENPNVSGQKSYATQQKNFGKQDPPWIRQVAQQTQKLSRDSHAATRATKERESRRLTREMVPTEACGVFSESRVPAGCSPAQHIPTPSQLKKPRNMTCIICDSKFNKKEYVRYHFPKCVQKNGNPNGHSWFDHPTIQNKNDTQSKILDNGFGPFPKKTDDEPTIDPSSPLPRLQADPATPVEHRTTGGKGISDATIASWLAAQSNEDIDEDDYNAENEMETSESAWQYHVTRQEILTADLGLIDTTERKYGPYCTLEEANVMASEEIQIRDVSPPPGTYPRGWNLQFRKDEDGMDSYTVEVTGTTISTTVTRKLIPRAELAKRRMPASAFITPPTVYTVLSVSIHHTTRDVDIKPHGHYTLRTKANERAGEIWVEQFAGLATIGAVKKYDLEREIRKEIRELAQVEECFFDRMVDGEGKGAVGRVWVVEEVVRGPRN